jgi:hypothetical protein
MKSFIAGDRVILLKGPYQGSGATISYVSDQGLHYVHGDWQAKLDPTFYGPIQRADLNHEE